MKKKIINGILMAALMLTATTSFVSCKDNVDDELVQVYDNLAKQKTALETKITNLETTLQNKINELGDKVQQNANDIKTLQDEIKGMKDELKDINDAIENLNGEVADLKTRMDNIEKRVDDLEKLMEDLVGGIITDLIAEHTVNHVFGSMNIPGYNMLSLAAFYGENITGIKEFPVAGESSWDYIVGNNVLKNSDIEGADKYTFKQTITQPHGNAGKLFFTVNSVDYNKFDISNYVLTLEGSNGKVAPITFSNIIPSTFDIQWGVYKSEEVASLTESTIKNGFYEAEATIADEDLDATKFDIKQFIDLKQLKKNLQSAKENIMASNGKAAIKQIAKEAAQILVNFYSGKMSINNGEVNNPSYRPQRLVISKLMEDGSLERKSQTGLEIATTAVAPLSYKSFWQLENNAKYLDMDLVYKALYKLTEKVKSWLPGNGKGVSVPQIVKITGDGQVWVKYENETILVSELEDDDDDLEGEWADINDVIYEAINNGLSIEELNEALQKLGKATNVGKAVDSVANHIHHYLNYYSTKLINGLHNHWLTRAVLPMILFNGAEGLDRMYYGMTVRPGNMQIYMTSATEELLVPAFAKYIAVVKDGEILQQETLPGSTQSWTLSFPTTGNYYVVMSAVDYYGNVANKKYLVRVR